MPLDLLNEFTSGSWAARFSVKHECLNMCLNSSYCDLCCRGSEESLLRFGLLR